MRQTADEFRGRRLAAYIVAGLAAFKLLLHLLTAGNYGLFVDELYFLACGQHLAWGYVDMPPVTALQGWLASALFGTSTWGIHLLPALMGAGLVWMAGSVAAELGGKLFARVLACLAILIAGGFLVAHSYLSMNALEPLIWLGCIWVVARICQGGDLRLWLAFGAIAGLGLMNKYTILVFGAALLIGLLLTPARKYLFNRWFLAGGVLAGVIFLPNLLWLVQHDFPMLELLANTRESGRNVSLTPLQFLADLVSFLHPLTLPVWLAGLGWFFFHPRGKPFAFVGWAFLFSLGILLAVDGRTYYLLPAFPMLLVGGAVGLETWLAGRRTAWVKPALLALLAVGGAITAPLFLPILPPEQYVRYAETLGVRQPRIETYQESQLPQLFADRFGWPEMAESVADVYRSLPPQQQAQAVILTGNYGQAGAIDLYGRALGLPVAISGHQNYYLWGTRGSTGEVVIALGIDPGLLKLFYNRVEYKLNTHHPYAMPYENTGVYVASEPRSPLNEVWERFKHWD